MRLSFVPAIVFSAAALMTFSTWAQSSAAGAVQASAPVAAKPKSTEPIASSKIPTSQPFWKELSPAEQTALRPLALNWDTMVLSQKRKWLSVAKDYDKLPAAQQAKLHTRMNEWVALSPQQRANARQNFAQHKELTDGLTPEQRKVQWQAYQQLSPEEKRQLASDSSKPALAGAATAAKPQPVLKKEPTPEFGTGKVLSKAQASPQQPVEGKKIALAPHLAAQGAILPGSNAPTEKP